MRDEQNIICVIARRMSEFIPNPKVKYYVSYDKLWERYKESYFEYQDCNGNGLSHYNNAYMEIVRKLCLEDLFFLVYFVMGVDCNDERGFVVRRCHELRLKEQRSSRNLDIWARFHYKSTLVTVGLNIQRRLRDPNTCSLLLSYKKGLGEEFLRAIKGVLENETLVKVFSDILWERAEDSPSWSVKGGLTLKRSGSARPQSSFQSGGLIDGMPTGGHYDDIFYDDIETNDMKYNHIIMRKAYEQFDMSDNLGMANQNDMRWILGTFYSYLGPLMEIKKEQFDDGTPIWDTTIIPITEDGTSTGIPVLVSQKKLEELRRKKHFKTQHLLDPSPQEYAKLRSEMLDVVSSDLIPENLYKVLIVDWASDNPDYADDQKDAWSIMVVGIDVTDKDEFGANDIYICDLTLRPMSTTAAIEETIMMYRRNGIIQKLCIEKQGASNMMAVNVAKALAGLKREITYENGRLLDLSSNKNKEYRITDALEWLFVNGKIHIDKDKIKGEYIDRYKREMDLFGTGWHDDGLDSTAYAVQVFEDYSLDVKRYTRKVEGNVIRPLSFKNVKTTWMAN